MNIQIDAMLSETGSGSKHKANVEAISWLLVSYQHLHIFREVFIEVFYREVCLISGYRSSQTQI